MKVQAHVEAQDIGDWADRVGNLLVEIGSQKAEIERLRKEAIENAHDESRLLSEQGDTLRENGLLKVEIERLNKLIDLAASQKYCTMCGETIDGYVPPKTAAHAGGR